MLSFHNFPVSDPQTSLPDPHLPVTAPPSDGRTQGHLPVGNPINSISLDQTKAINAPPRGINPVGQPWQGGGNMIVDITFEHTKFHDAPSRFEAGTGNIADALGLGAAIDYVNRIGIDLIHSYEHALLDYATNLMSDVPGLRFIGTAKEKASVLSFVLAGYKTEEVGAALNKEGIAVRSGHHCAQPILRRFGLETTVRPSLAFYNTTSDIDVLLETLYRLSHNRNK